MEETVLYYAPDQIAHVSLLKGVLEQMGVRMLNLTPGRCGQRIGFLVGMEGFEDLPEADGLSEAAAAGQQTAVRAESMTEELLVLSGFSEERLEELLERLKDAGVPKIGLKAIVTETNAHWTVYELYRQLQAEHWMMSLGRNRS